MIEMTASNSISVKAAFLGTGWRACCVMAGAQMIARTGRVATSAAGAKSYANMPGEP